jgi:hypothetical protein
MYYVKQVMYKNEMKNRRNLRHSNKVRQSLKLTLTFAAASATALILLLVVVFNFSRQESSFAGGTMVFIGANTIQDTTFVYRGSANQEALGLVIQTSGDGSPLKVSSIEFKASCSQGKNSENLENARLWTTGSDAEFACISQVGSTITMITDDKIMIDVNRYMTAGLNYFWLTFDVKPGANSPGSFDVACSSIKVGALSYLPYLSSPEGNRQIAGNNAYYSQGDLLVNHPDSWNSSRDGSGVIPKEISNQRNVYFIQSGHQMQNVRPTGMAAITIESGGSLKSLAVLKLKSLVVEGHATYQQVASVTDFYSIDRFVVANGGTYIHDNTGYVPGLRCEFKPGSTEKFLQYGQATFPYTVTWGNVIIASSSNINFDIQKNFRYVKGNLEFQRTGGDNYLFCDATDTMNIDGNLIFSGGNFTGVTGKDHTLTINVKGNLLMNSGIFTDAESVGTNNSSSILNITGDVNITGGTIDYALSRNSASMLNFTGISTMDSRWLQSDGEIRLGNVNIKGNKVLTLIGPQFGTIAAKHALTVESEGTLMCGKVQINGDGGFILEDKAMMGIGHAAGINSTGSEGNIITAKRNFNSGAGYVYYMDVNPQKTGKFSTQPWSGTVRNFTVKKTSSSNWLVLSQDFMVSDSINIIKGIVEKNSKKLLKTDTSQEAWSSAEKISAANK